MEFEGNRIDAIGSKGASPKAEVRIDGKRPSEFPECYAIARPAPGPWSPLFLSRVDHDKPLLLEEWTAKITSVSDDGKKWKFTVKGSVTGEDGSGESDKPFLSNSARVKIAPDAWFAPGKVPADYEVHWKVVPMFQDTLQSATEQTLAQGLANTKHRLEIIGDASISAIRVYQPPVK